MDDETNDMNMGAVGNIGYFLGQVGTAVRVPYGTIPDRRKHECKNKGLPTPGSGDPGVDGYGLDCGSFFSFWITSKASSVQIFLAHFLLYCWELWQDGGFHAENHGSGRRDDAVQFVVFVPTLTIS